MRIVGDRRPSWLAGAALAAGAVVGAQAVQPSRAVPVAVVATLGMLSAMQGLAAP